MIHRDHTALRASGVHLQDTPSLRSLPALPLPLPPGAHAVNTHRLQIAQHTIADKLNNIELRRRYTTNPFVGEHYSPTSPEN